MFDTAHSYACATRIPVAELVAKQARNVGEFDRVIGAEGAEIIRVGPRAPNMNAFAERWVQSLRQECLDHFVVLGAKHLDHLVAEYVEHYHRERPHQGIGNIPLQCDDPLSKIEAEPLTSLSFPEKIKCHERLGGKLKHYTRHVA